jgi:hypothetical protein
MPTTTPTQADLPQSFIDALDQYGGAESNNASNIGKGGPGIHERVEARYAKVLEEARRLAASEARDVGELTDERTAFEAWAVSECYFIKINKNGNHGRYGLYECEGTQTAWKAWKARAALATRASEAASTCHAGLYADCGNDFGCAGCPAPEAAPLAEGGAKKRIQDLMLKWINVPTGKPAKAVWDEIDVALTANLASQAAPSAPDAQRDREISKLIDERDTFEHLCTALSDKIGELLGSDVGEWSSANNPALRALHLIEDRLAAPDAQREDEGAVATRLLDHACKRVDYPETPGMTLYHTRIGRGGPYQLYRHEAVALYRNIGAALGYAAKPVSVDAAKEEPTRFSESDGEGGGVYEDRNGNFVRYSDYCALRMSRAASDAAKGEQQP